jgi:predicted lipoprotein
LFVLAAFATCRKPEPPSEENPANGYDQKPMFQNYSSNLILPSYNLLKEKLDSLFLAVQNFNSTTTEINLDLTKAAYLKAYKQYMYCSTYEFGPAATIIFRSSTNIFPTDTIQINTNIATGTYDFNSAAQTDAIGFPAIDFILYGNNKTATYITNLFSTTTNRKQYLLDLCTDLQSKVNTVISGWSTYTTTFNNATGNAAGNSLSNLVNEFNYDYEITKNARVGIPLGKQTLGIALPEKCEALYSGSSLILLKEKVNALEV